MGISFWKLVLYVLSKKVLNKKRMALFKKNIFLLAVLFPIAALFSGNVKEQQHEFHISKCQIEYNEEAQALQISLHLFIDDLEEALRQHGADKLYICTEKESEKAESYIYKYLQQKLQIDLEGQAIHYGFLGKEISEDLAAVWCYLEVENITAFAKMRIKNNLLMEVFDDQKNIISVLGPKQKKSYFLFDQANNEETLEF